MRKLADITRSRHSHHYLHLLALSVLSFIAMFVLMYATVDEFGNVFLNSNQFYMAGLMTMLMMLSVIEGQSTEIAQIKKILAEPAE